MSIGASSRGARRKVVGLDMSTYLTLSVSASARPRDAYPVGKTLILLGRNLQGTPS